MAALLFEDKVKLNRTAFVNRVRDIAANLNMDPNWLMSVMNFETAGTFSPSVKNPNSSATGLIQFMDATARDLGTTTAELAQMTNVQQLDYVEKYYKKQIAAHGTIDNIAEAYLAVFYPVAISWPMDRLFPRPVYLVNKVFDTNGDGEITKQEIVDKIVSTVPAQFASVIAQKKTL